MTTAISIEDVRREVKILKALSGHNNLVKFYDACEDALNVYIVMEYVFLWPFVCDFIDLKFRNTRLGFSRYNIWSLTSAGTH